VTGFATLKTAMAAWDPGLDRHAERVCAHAEAIAHRLGWTEDRLTTLRLGAAFHDVGKVAIRADLLSKPGALDDDERAEIRAHPVEGMWLIVGIDTLVPALPYVLFHHERWDGLGYPTRRAGNDIPIEGRVLAVADAFDAMTSVRPYRPAFTLDDAVAEVRRCSGSQFDPEVAAALLDAVAAGDVTAHAA
jgi:HD-GYP domain-containing protein (c-di-GMP phosphodiesterase class II)